MLQSALEAVVSMILENPKSLEDDLWKVLDESQQQSLIDTIRQIKKNEQSEMDVLLSIKRLIRERKKQLLQQEITQKNQEYLTTENPELKLELDALKKEMKTLTQDE